VVLFQRVYQCSELSERWKVEVRNQTLVGDRIAALFLSHFLESGTASEHEEGGPETTVVGQLNVRVQPETPEKQLNHRDTTYKMCCYKGG